MMQRILLLAAVSAVSAQGGPDACGQAYNTESSCNADAKCVWCKSAAIPSSCYTIADSKKLPPGVFECDAKASPSTVVLTYHMLPDCSDNAGMGAFCKSCTLRACSFGGGLVPSSHLHCVFLLPVAAANKCMNEDTQYSLQWTCDASRCTYNAYNGVGCSSVNETAGPFGARQSTGCTSQTNIYPAESQVVLGLSYLMSSDT